MFKLSQLFAHPVKSMRGLQLSHAQVSESGLAFDRIFMITTPTGMFVTARQYPQLVCFTPALISNGIVIIAPDNQSQTILFSDFTADMQPTEVWGNQFTAHIAPEKINRWLSSYLNQEVQLRWVGPEMTRRVKPFPHIPLSFADGFPYLLINEGSFQALQDRCTTDIQLPQFRPNLVISGAPAFAEDSWKTIRVGEVIFDIVKPCSRCVLTTVNIESGRKNTTGEPLYTLQQFRTAENGDVNFGQNMIARNNGVIRLNDRVEILETQPAPVYLSKAPIESIEVEVQPLKPVVIEYGEHVFSGNNQQVLLEQLEQQGIQVNYSCRAGICGCCKVTLLSGEVEAMKKGAVKNNGTILACSCVPKGNIKLAQLK